MLTQQINNKQIAINDINVIINMVILSPDYIIAKLIIKINYLDKILDYNLCFHQMKYNQHKSLIINTIFQ